MAGVSCPSVVNGHSFASVAQLRRLVKQENRFGERYLASRAHNRTIGWIKDEVGAIDGFKVRSDRYRLWRWLPRTKAKGRPGLDLARAGGLTVTSNGATKKMPVAGAVRWSKPTGKRGQKGQLVYLGPDEEITPQNAAGKVVIREFPATSLPYAALAGHRPLHHSRSCRRDRKLRAPVHQQAARRSCSRRVRLEPPGSSSRSMCRASR